MKIDFKSNKTKVFIITGCVVLGIIVVVLGLWLGGVFSSSGPTVSPTEEVSTAYCTSNGNFQLVNTISENTVYLGENVAVDQTGSYMSTVQAESPTAPAASVVYKRNGETWAKLGTHTFETKPGNLSHASWISPSGLFLVTDSRNNSNQGSELFVSQKDQDNFFTNIQRIEFNDYSTLVNLSWTQGLDANADFDELVSSWFKYDENNPEAFGIGVVRVHHVSHGTGIVRLAQTISSPSPSEAYFYGIGLHALSNVLAIAFPPKILIYTRNTNSAEWVRAAALDPDPPTTIVSSLLFGIHCILSDGGKVLAVGDPLTSDTSDNTRTGRVHTYVRNLLTDKFVFGETIEAHGDSKNNAQFGSWLGLENNTLVVARGDTDLTQRSQEVYTIDTKTGAAAFVKSIPWPIELAEVSVGLGGMPAMFVDDHSRSLYLVSGYPDKASAKGQITTQKVQCA